MAARKARSSSKKPKTIDEKIKKCKTYLDIVKKQSNPSNQEISDLNKTLLELEKLKSTKGNHSKVVCRKPKTIDEKIVKCKTYLDSIKKQTNPSNQEISELNKTLLELEKLKSTKGDHFKVVCIKPKSLDSNDNKKKLSPGEIVAIVIGSIIALIIIISLSIFFLKKQAPGS